MWIQYAWRSCLLLKMHAWGHKKICPPSDLAQTVVDTWAKLLFCRCTIYLPLDLLDDTYPSHLLQHLRRARPSWPTKVPWGPSLLPSTAQLQPQLTRSSTAGRLRHVCHGFAVTGLESGSQVGKYIRLQSCLTERDAKGPQTAGTNDSNYFVAFSHYPDSP